MQHYGKKFKYNQLCKVLKCQPYSFNSRQIFSSTLKGDVKIGINIFEDKSLL